MANVWATKTGVWSDTTVWNTGVLPTASDAVWASGSTVLINQDINVQSLNNFATGSGAAGGTFNCYSSQTITSSLFRSGTTNLLNITGSGLTVNLVGTVSSSTSVAINTINVPNTFIGSTLNMNGTFTVAGATGASTNTSFAASGSTLNITGNIGTGIGSANIINSTATNSTINITGNITPGLGGYCLTAGGTSNNYTLTGSIVSGGTTGNGINFSAVSSSFNMLGNLSSLVTITNAFQFVVGSISSTIRINGNISGSTGQNSSLSLGGSYNTIIITGSVIGHPTTTGGGAILMGGYQTNLILSGSVSASAGNGILFNNLTTPITCSIIGDIQTSGSSGFGITFGTTTGPITCNITGSVYVRSTSFSTGYGISIGNGSTANNITLNMSGSIYAGLIAGANTNYGLLCSSNFNTINIRGDVYGGTGSYGLYNSGTSTVIISGSVYGGPSAATYGAANNSTGILRVIGAVGSTISPALYGVSPYGITTFESVTFPTNGLVPLVGYCEMVVGGNSFASCSLSASGYNILIDSNNISNGQPAASNVRLGTTYNFGSTSGSMVVPSASYVALGTPVDNTSGSLVISSNNIASAVWNTQLTSITTSGSIGDRLKNSATVANVGNQLATLL